jgi:outer membrane lipoprotein SlyB
MRIALPFAAMLLIGVTGCASQAPGQTIVMSTEGTTLVQSAQVTNLRDVAVRGGRPSGIGAFIGAILGGVAGSKIGSGYGSTVASIGGTFAGGWAGHQVEQAALGMSATEATVRMENGDSRIYQVHPDENLRIGDTVKLITQGGITRISR